MAIVRLTAATAIAACDAVVDRIDTGGAAGTIRLREGAPPSDADAAATGQILAVLTFRAPGAGGAFGAAADANPGGRATAAAITEDSGADAAGTAGYAEILTSAGTVVFIGDVTATGGGGMIEMDNPVLALGQTVRISSFTVTMPQG